MAGASRPWRGRFWEGTYFVFVEVLGETPAAAAAPTDAAPAAVEDAAAAPA